MKYVREIKVGVLAVICLFLLFFGMNFLKGVNIFTSTNTYHGVYAHIHGLEEQAPVYIRGYKVGQVDAIHYDFTRDSAFVVDISINTDVRLPQGTVMAIVPDGLLGGVAVEMQCPLSSEVSLAQTKWVEKGSFVPTVYVPGLVESMQGELLAHVDLAVQDVDSLIAQIKSQIEGNHIQSSLANVDRIASDLTYVSADLKELIRTRVPTIVDNADTTLANLNVIVADLRAADLQSTVLRVDTAVDQVNALLADVRSQDGTLGQLIYNKSLYQHIDATVVSADSLLTDLKAHPKKYVHFSIFGKKR